MVLAVDGVSLAAAYPGRLHCRSLEEAHEYNHGIGYQQKDCRVYTTICIGSYGFLSITLLLPFQLSELIQLLRCHGKTTPMTFPMIKLFDTCINEPQLAVLPPTFRHKVSDGGPHTAPYVLLS